MWTVVKTAHHQEGRYPKSSELLFYLLPDIVPGSLTTNIALPKKQEERFRFGYHKFNTNSSCYTSAYRIHLVHLAILIPVKRAFVQQMSSATDKSSPQIRDKEKAEALRHCAQSLSSWLGQQETLQVIWSLSVKWPLRF